ncbi:hypothetical protein BDB00DRAFT_867933 [Zychaea mexicana]|uniref:uncharacterized protein n=1 Tax=Zychaea mexicana TaxID=64656 RepID=UPI0022FE14A3|nr:uncharacterized protein BDB00DRAFT_867933 [Zychaea mexicana]KAI9497805.1 hypothetical protein BDB00DRAFT_867933 [Zychaea mexicana]
MLELLEIRAYAYSIQGKLYSAIADTQRMIGYAPISSIGYLCKANIYATYGYQIRAIEAYDEGLKHSTASSHPCTAIYHQWCHEELEDARAKAVARNDNRIDIIAKLTSGSCTFHSSTTLSSKRWHMLVCFKRLVEIDNELR